MRRLATTDLAQQRQFMSGPAAGDILGMAYDMVVAGELAVVTAQGQGSAAPQVEEGVRLIPSSRALVRKQGDTT